MQKNSKKVRLIGRGGSSNMEIKIGIGLDDIVFGMSQEEVKTIMGKPDKISELDERIVYYFNVPLIKTAFDMTDDYKMYSIEVFNPETILFNKKVINETKSDIFGLLNSNGYYEIEGEEYDTFETLFCKDIWSTFMFEFNRLKSVEFSPLYGDDDKLIWPKRLNYVSF